MSRPPAPGRAVRRPRRSGLLAVGLAAALATSLAGCGAPGMPGAGGPQDDPGAAVTEDQATRVLQRVLADDAAARSGKPGAASSLASTYAGEGLVAAKAAVQFIAAGVTSPASGVPTDIKVLSTSRGTDYPRYILGASTAPNAQLPVVHLLVATKPDTPYRLTLNAQMLPGAQINAFPGLGDGARVVTNGAAMDLKPADLPQSYAEGLAAPKDDAPYESDTFAEQVHSRAEAAKKAVASQADFTQTFQVRPDPVVAFRELNGDTLVLGAIERVSDYLIKPGQQMQPTPYFSALVPNRTVLVQQVRTQVSQSLIFTVPKQGKARLVAATEQITGASGY